MLSWLERLLGALEGQLNSHDALRLRVRLRRRQRALLAGLLGVGILLMVFHWASATGRGPAHAPTTGTAAGPGAPALHQATDGR